MSEVAPLLAEIQRSTARELLQLAEIEHLTRRVTELEAQQGEPVAYADPKAFDNFKAGSATHEWMWAFSDTGLIPLYRQAEPAKAKVALPERKTFSDYRYMRKADGEAAASQWNACLDEVAKLNPTP